MRGISWVVSRPSMSSRTVTRLPVGSSSTAIQIAPNPSAAISSDTRVAMSSRSAIDANRDVIFASKLERLAPLYPSNHHIVLRDTKHAINRLYSDCGASAICARIGYYMTSFR